MVSLPRLPSHAALIAGTWPGARQNGPEQVAAPSVLAARLHLAPGDTIVLREATTGAREPVEITGIFSPRQQASPYWSLQAGLNGLPAGSGLQNPVVTSSLPELLSGLATALVVARSQLAIGVLAFLVIAGATVALATTLLSQQRESEAALLRSRGASRRQMAATGTAEAVLLVLPVAAAVPVLGGLLLPWLGGHGPLAHSALRLPVSFPSVAWLAAGAGAAGCAVIIAQGWLRAAGSPVRARALRGRQRALASAARWRSPPWPC